MGFVDSNTEVKFSAVSEAGLAYEVTRTKIDRYFAKLGPIFKKACAKHQTLLEKYNEMIVYCQHRKIPSHMKNKDACPRCGSPGVTNWGIRCLPCLEKAHYEVSSFIAQFKNLALIIRESEKKSGIGYTTPQDLCLEVFNSMIVSRNKVWNTFESMREFFDNHQRGFLLDYFIQKSESFRQTLYWPCLEKMMYKVSRKYNEAYDRLRKDVLMDWIHKELLKKDRFVPIIVKDSDRHRMKVYHHTPATISEAFEGIESFPKSCQSLYSSFSDFSSISNRYHWG